MAEIMSAHNNWANRPADERFLSLTDLDTHFNDLRTNSRTKTMKLGSLTANAKDTGEIVLANPEGKETSMTNWSFGQLAKMAEAPQGYIRSLPATLAASCINHGIQANQSQEIGMLLTKQVAGDATSLTTRAMTSAGYGRVYNADITRQLVERFGNGLEGDWKVPGEFGKAVPVTKETTTFYGSDRDMYVFLADETHRLELPNRRDGKTGSLSKGFIVWNSEVGAGTLGVAMFLFDYMCSNHIIWGVTGKTEMKLRHTKTAPERYMDEIGPMIAEYGNEKASIYEAQLIAAQNKFIGDAATRTEDVDKFLTNRFNAKMSQLLLATHIKAEQRPIETLWDVTTAVTEHAKSIPYMNERIAFEREGGKILDLVAN